MNACARCAVALVLLVPCVLVAQQKLSKDEDEECEKAAKIVAKGHPEKKELDALGTLSRCGVIGAAAMVNGLAQYTTETDIATLETFMSALDN